jgi:hypothetical protein
MDTRALVSVCRQNYKWSSIHPSNQTQPNPTQPTNIFIICMYVCMYVFMYVCMYVCIYIYIYIYIQPEFCTRFSCIHPMRATCPSHFFLSDSIIQ